MQSTVGQVLNYRGYLEFSLRFGVHQETASPSCSVSSAAENATTIKAVVPLTAALTIEQDTTGEVAAGQ
jgi:hypothetical protein